MFIRLTTIISSILLLTACASINSKQINDGSTITGGLNYYLPKRDLIITVMVSDPKVDKLTTSKNAYLAQAKYAKLQAKTEKDPLERQKLLERAVKYEGIAGELQEEIDNHKRVPEITKTEAALSSAYPDTSAQYSLNYNKNLFGKNSLDVGVSENGLLNSTKSISEPQLSEVLSSIASAGGLASGIDGLSFRLTESRIERHDFKEKKAKVNCTKEGIYIFKISFETPENYSEDKDREICEHNNKEMVSFSLERPGEYQTDGEGIVKNLSATAPKSTYGIYYRQNVPYYLKLNEGGIKKEILLMVPDTRFTHFLPIHKTVFANNEADFAFKDGIPTKYIQKSEAELVALLSIPADVIAAYFGAVGSVFTSFSENAQAEISALDQSVLLELAKQKNEACLSAIKAGDTDLIENLKCAGE